MKSQIARTSKGPIEYTSLGSGPTLMVCHGTSSNCFSTELAGPLVEAGFSVLTPSRPGNGNTPLDVGRSAAQAAEALVTLLDSLKIQTFGPGFLGGRADRRCTGSRVPERITRLVLAEAITHPENRPNEPGYKKQTGFCGPMHNVMWGMLGLMSRLSPRGMARQTVAIFSTHDPADGLSKLSPDDIQKIARFYQGRSSRKGALNDGTQSVGANLLKTIQQPTLVIHSREDHSVPFAHAEWSLKYIPQAELCEAGFTGHFFWRGRSASTHEVALVPRSGTRTTKWALVPTQWVIARSKDHSRPVPKHTFCAASNSSTLVREDRHRFTPGMIWFLSSYEKSG